MIAGRMSAEVGRFMCMMTIDPFHPRSAAHVMAPGSRRRVSALSTAHRTTARYPASFAAWMTFAFT